MARRYLRNSCALTAMVVASCLGLPAFAQTDESQPAESGPIVTLTQALSVAYYNNATLQEQRAELRQADENVPAAISGWRPTVTLDGSAGRVVGSETEFVPGSEFSTDSTEKLNENRDEAIGADSLWREEVRTSTGICTRFA